VRSGGAEDVPLAADDGRKGFYGGGRCGVTLGGGEDPQSSLITSRVAQQREISFPAAYWTEAEALARAEKWRAVLEAWPLMVRVLTDRFLGQIEIGQIGRITYPAFGFDEGFVGVVVGWRESLTARRVEITLWGAG
jgi:hypothetical protein